MPDREKVIKALEYCIGRNGCWSDDNHEECPWISKCREDSSSLKRDALAMLKEQEAVVRCKDCRHYTGKDCNYNDIFPAPREDWYCADGERRQKNE